MELGGVITDYWVVWYPVLGAGDRIQNREGSCFSIWKANLAVASVRSVSDVGSSKVCLWWWWARRRTVSLALCKKWAQPKRGW